MIETRKLTFYTLAQLCSYTKTAEKLNITQPAVSQHIKYLEEEYGVQLIRKEGRKVYLTEEGEIFYKHIEKVFSMEEEVARILQNQNSIIKKYSLGATKTIGAYLIPDILGKYKINFPNHEVILEVDNTEEILNKLDEGKLDLALIEGEFNKKKYNNTLLKLDELVLVVSKMHPFAKKREVTLKEILKQNLITREIGSGTRKIIEKHFQSNGYIEKDWNTFMEIGDITAIKSLVKWNLGYSFISREAVKKEVEEKSLVVIDVKDFKMQRGFYFVWKKEKKISFISDFIKFSKRCII
ncbi:LysR family transcriptional regulator [Haloimpatiens sp. FM7330]|uniref:LysR family transcriptional regulator n=1 Tax=Haloimpatiens sp. FM7330 TaxID=3298610 RepID=UPI00362E3C33